MTHVQVKASILSSHLSGLCAVRRNGRAHEGKTLMSLLCSVTSRMLNTCVKKEFLDHSFYTGVCP